MPFIAKYFMALAAILVAIVVVPIIAFFIFSTIYNWNWEMNALPQSVEVTKVIASSSSSGLTEGCEVAVYELSPNLADALLKRGVSALNEDIVPRGHTTPSDNPLSPWKSTPIPPEEKEYWTGTFLAGGCNNGVNAYYVDINKLKNNPGSFYTMTKNREGGILISPAEKLVVYSYFG